MVLTIVLDGIAYGGYSAYDLTEAIHNSYTYGRLLTE